MFYLFVQTDTIIRCFGRKNWGYILEISGGSVFQNCVKNMDIIEVKTAPKSPWQNPYVERFIKSIIRDCLDHMIVLNKVHLKRVLADYFGYYHHDRTHLGLKKETPFGRPLQKRPKNGQLIKFPRVGGLHHRYEWRKAA